MLKLDLSFLTGLQLFSTILIVAANLVGGQLKQLAGAADLHRNRGVLGRLCDPVRAGQVDAQISQILRPRLQGVPISSHAQFAGALGSLHGGAGQLFPGTVIADRPIISGGCGVIDICGKLRPEVQWNRLTWGLDHTPGIGVEPYTHAGETGSVSMWRDTDAVASWSWAGAAGLAAIFSIIPPAMFISILKNALVGTLSMV